MEMRTLPLETHLVHWSKFQTKGIRCGNDSSNNSLKANKKLNLNYYVEKFHYNQIKVIYFIVIS